LYFGEGQLIAVPRQAQMPMRSTVEFFWLCGNCAAQMNLKVASNGVMNLLPIPLQARSRPNGLPDGLKVAMGGILPGRDL